MSQPPTLLPVAKKLLSTPLITALILLIWGYPQVTQAQSNLSGFPPTPASTPVPGATAPVEAAAAVATPCLGNQITLKAGIEGAYVHTIQDNPAEAPSFDKAGKHGPGGGGGLLFEARFLRFLGLETALLFESNTRTKEIEITESFGTITYFPKVSANNLRIPIILKGVLSMPISGREEANVWIGAGPEFVIPTSVRGEIDHEIRSSYNVTLTDSSRVRLQNLSDGYNERTREKSAVHLTVGTGFGLPLGPVEVGLAARASWNFSHENLYVQNLCVGRECMTDRYEYSEHTLDVRAMLRVLYIFPVM